MPQVWGLDKLEATMEIEDYERTAKDLIKELAGLKEEAKHSRRPVLLTLGKREYQVMPTGRPFYPFCLAHTDHLLWFAERELRTPLATTPPVAVAITSEFLWRHRNPWFSWRRTLTAVEAFGLRYLDSKLSRLDLCCDRDFHPLRPNDVQDIVCSSRKRDLMNQFFLAPNEMRTDHYGHEWVNMKEAGRRLAQLARQTESPMGINTYYRAEGRAGDLAMTGVVVGRGGDKLLRDYHKSLEVTKISRKLYMFHFWAQEGLDIERPVWRTEFQIRRPALRELTEYVPLDGAEDEAEKLRYLDSVEDVLKALPGLWRYMTGSWLQFRDRASDVNTTRADIREWWRQVMNPPDPPDTVNLVERTERVVEAKWEMTRAQLMGWLSHLPGAMRTGATPEEVGLAVTAMLQELTPAELERFQKAVKLRRGTHYMREDDLRAESAGDRPADEGPGTEVHDWR